MDQKKAAYFLRMIDEGFAFRCADGQVARSLEALLSCLEQMSQETYQHHVYFDHNDFSNWLLDIIGDDKLALDLFHAEQHKAVALLRARLHFIKAHAPAPVLP